MENIISKVDRDLIKGELTPDKFLRKTRKGGNDIYIVTAFDSPNTMREIGRLREIAFRDSGGGTGKDCDIDEFDIMETPCKQLIVWNEESEEIIGGYRFILGEDVAYDENSVPHIATSHMFTFTPEFIKEYMPYTLELGRSFVSLDFQSASGAKKGVYALDNLWDGLGALTVKYPQLKYFFGKVTMYPSYHKNARNKILYFLHKYFPDRDNLVYPINALKTDTDVEWMKGVFDKDDFKTEYMTLNSRVRALGYNIPPLVNAYMSLSPTMRVFGTAINDEFGDVEETGILITINDIFEDKRIRYIDTFIEQQNN